MSRFSLALALFLGALAGTRSEAAIVLNFAAAEGSNISFTPVVPGTSASFTLTPGTVTLLNPGGRNFEITSVFNGLGDAVGLFGDISGSYTFGTPITVIGPLQTASLSGSGTLTLYSPSGNFTGTITGIDIASLGTGGLINTSGSINLTNVAYTGTNSDLIQLRDEATPNGGVTTLSFQFAQGVSLTTLLNNPFMSSYSGSITAVPVPEPGTVALALTGLPLLGLGYLSRRRRARA
ncbi:PEP-CTERM sorting domain-containing protein [Tautonia rosea]|uniref:PEP-CTERM sorting domain-containing protein n=1 Tax=Tautonia rosea TaxID=2728037 RepID=UPI001474D564|nr:PEP-CTERM sorting domain-containing protein [Tautonia rosea]